MQFLVIDSPWECPAGGGGIHRTSDDNPDIMIFVGNATSFSCEFKVKSQKRGYRGFFPVTTGLFGYDVHSVNPPS